MFPGRKILYWDEQTCFRNEKSCSGVENPGLGIENPGFRVEARILGIENFQASGVGNPQIFQGLVRDSP